MRPQTPQTKEEKARAFARELYPAIIKIEKYLDLLIEKEHLLLHPRPQAQLRRAKDAVYSFRICLHYERCKFNGRI